MQNSLSYKNNHILLVDDNETSLLYLEGILKDAGYTSIYLSKSAEEAYSILDKKKVDLILLDVMMPEIDGIEACTTIKNMEHYKHRPIIMVTADSSDETLQASFNAGANDYVTKPANTISLLSRMHNIFSHIEKDTIIQNQTRLLAMGEVINVLAHQWRQPLNIISTSAMNIQISRDLDDKSEEQEKNEKKSLKRISDLSQKLSQTINEIGIISHDDIEINNANINEIIQMAINIMQDTFQNQNISLQTTMSEIKNIPLLKNELTRALLMILLNSKEAFIRNEITSNKVMKIATSQNDTHTIISIKDNAGGISKKNILKVFDPYFSTKYELNSTGLGLYNCKIIIEKYHGGTIEISSSDTSTEVTIHLLNNEDLNIKKYFV